MSQLEGLASAGTLDPTLNGTGVLYFPLSAIYGLPDAILALPEDKTLVAMGGSAVRNASITVARLNGDGTLDTTFGPAQHGFVEVSFDDTEVQISGLSLLANGGWLILGQYSLNKDAGLFIVRQFQDGQLDETFDGDGKLFLPFRDLGNSKYTGVRVDASRRTGEETSGVGVRATRNAGTSVVEQSDGKIILVTNVIDASAKQRGIVLRRNSDGSRDESFNGAGFAIVELGGVEHQWSSAEGVAVQADGQVLVSGLYVVGDQADSIGAYVTRFNAQGQVDSGFNGGLPVTISNAAWINLSFITVRESDGRIAAVGNALRGGINNGLIVVLNASGSYNRPFNKGQPLYSELVSKGQGWWRCALRANGSIIVTGSTGNGFVSKDLAAITARYLADGSLDLTFNEGKGFTVFNDGQGFESSADMAVMADGRIIVYGDLWQDAEPWPDIVGGWILRYLA